MKRLMSINFHKPLYHDHVLSLWFAEASKQHATFSFLNKKGEAGAKRNWKYLKENWKRMTRKSNRIDALFIATDYSLKKLA